MPKRANGEGTIYRDGDRWRAAIPCPDGRRASKRFATRAEAAAWLAAQSTAISRGEYVAKSGTTVGEWVKEYLAVYVAPRVRPRTLERYISTANRLGAIADCRLQDLCAPQVQAMLNVLSSELGGSSLLKVYSLLKRAIGKAVALGTVSKNIMHAVESPNYNQPVIEIFTRAEIGILLAAIKSSQYYSRYYLFFQTAVLTGARLGELLALRRSAVGDGRLYIRSSLSRADGQTIALAPKTQAGRREVTISTALCRDLKSRAAEGSVVEIDPYVFHTSSGKPYGARNIQRVWSAVLKLAGLPRRHFHALRHTHATELLAAGVPILEVKKRLGHSKASQTLNMYGHAIAGFDKQIPSIAENIFSPQNVR